MDVFALRDQLVADYEAFTRSFIHVKDDQIREVVDRELAQGLLWPESLIQLNPSFQAGATIDHLVAEGILHDANRAIFRRGKAEGAAGAAGSAPLRLHQHQEEAIRVATTGANYVLTTGTGSGKSLTYIVPIVDRVLREGPGKGIRAIVVYPMNALANSQVGELEKFLKFGYPDNAGPVTFARYTGQEKEEQRQAIIATPPDILLTNYVMLELLLTRPIEKGLVEAARDLRFLVLDELHTYRGRQGADVALLVRRVREATKATRLQVVGTSATLAGGDAIGQQRVEIADVASRLFGAKVEPAHVVGETLVRATQPPRPADPTWVAALRSRVASGAPAPTEAAAFGADPLASWIEGVIGLEEEAGTGRLVRARPRAIGGPDGAAIMLADLVGLDEDRCAAAIRQTLYAGFRVTLPGSVFPVFAFRLHQFFSRGDTVFASLEEEGTRHLTTQGQQFVPGDRSRVLLPLAFCRECGQDYYTVGRRKDLSGTYTYEPRELSDVTADEDRDRGFVYVGSESPWPDNANEETDRVPDDWLEEKADGRLVVKSDRRKNLPSIVHLGADGRESPGGLRVAFMPAPFKFCLSCGVEYSNRQTRDLGKLATLGSGGRSSATSLLSITAVRSLRHDPTLEPRARKLLAFTDNRQDASLQAGHLNDTVEVGLLRSALYRAAATAGAPGLGHDELAIRVAEALNLPIAEYARDPAVKFAAKAQTDAALRDVLGYRLYRDLERGWRVTAPNLEQAGLLEIRYESLDELAAADEEWASAHPALAGATPTQRRDVGKALLDHLRRELAIHVVFLREDWQEGMRHRSNERLVLPWAVDEEERLEHAAVAYPRGRKKAAPDYGGNVYLSPLGGLGQLMGRPGVLADTGKRLVTADRERIIRELCTILKIAGLLLVVDEPKEAGAVPGYQLASASMRWHAGDGTAAFHDPIRVPKAPEAGLAVNPYFVRFYREVAGDGVGIRAKEHTAQVASAEREEREEAFREGRLPILFCSPTMELGIDIAELNVVGLRNVPPTPANYAQRSGRAGRSGQPALVFAYCSTGSPHDAYFFRRPELMVAGQVAIIKTAWRTERRVYRPWQPVPGEHLAIDWGSEGGLHVFCAVLPWSRVRFVRFAADESQATTLALLAECFETLGGVPAVVLADRMGCLKGGVVANVVVPAPGYLVFAAHYGFRPDFCEAADPESKGVVENLVGYAKLDLMVPGGPFSDLAAANAAAVAWCAEVNGRVHSETSAVPDERLCAERPLLRPLPSLRPAPAPTAVRTVDRLRTVRYGSARYSVPGAFIGCRVDLVVAGGELLIHSAAGTEIARHGLVGPGEMSLDDAHYGGHAKAPARAIRPRTPAEIAFLALGPVAAAFLRAAAAAGTSRLGGELALIGDLERAHGREPLIAALERALAYRRFRAADVRSILAAGSGVPRHREPGERLAISLPAVPVRPLAAYALEPVA